MDFRDRYGCEIDYDNYGDCEAYGCIDEGICRCGTIENAHVTDSPDIITYIEDKYKNYPLFEKYIIERVLTHYKFYDTDSFEVKVGGGYYGQEIDGVFFTKEDEVNKTLEQILWLNDVNKQVEALLMLEYGHLLDSCKGRKWEVRDLDRSLIVFPNDSYYKKLVEVNRYKAYPYIKGVVIPYHARYKVIDGYHRLSTMAPLSTAKVLVGL